MSKTKNTKAAIPMVAKRSADQEIAFMAQTISDKPSKRCGCNATFVNPNCEQHGAHEYHGKPQAQHSPLPDRSTKAQWEALANESISDAGYWKSEARKAQAHAEALAEALRDCLSECEMRGSDRTESGLPHPATKAAREALANWEGGQQ